MAWPAVAQQQPAVCSQARALATIVIIATLGMATGAAALSVPGNQQTRSLRNLKAQRRSRRSSLQLAFEGFVVGRELLQADEDADDDDNGGQGGAEDAVTDMLTATSSDKRMVCLNTCRKAKNGVCEDGRMPPQLITKMPIRMAYCDLGTDCEDCGPFETSAAQLPWEVPNVPGPIALLMSKDVQVRVHEGVMPKEHNFMFAYTDPTKDYDVSYHMEKQGIVEPGITEIFYKIFNGRCVGPNGQPRLFVDVGANFGWFALLAAKMGCRVIAFEPVPIFRAFFEYSMYLNDLQGSIKIYNDVVCNEHSTRRRFVVPAKGIWGTAGIDGANIDHAIESKLDTLDLPTVTLDTLIREDVLLLKVDVEGFEWAVMQGAKQLLKERQVDNIIMEYSPGVPERAYDYEKMTATVTMLVDIIKAGFRIGHLNDGNKLFRTNTDWNAPPEPLPEVTASNLKYDLHDIGVWQSSRLGCPPVASLKQHHPWTGCAGVPEDLNPRSLRSEFAHNTNLWASKPTGIMRLNGSVGVVPPHAPPNTYFTSLLGGAMGLGGRSCAGQDPKVQVRHRCRCSQPAICGQEEKDVEAAAARGEIVTNYMLP